MEYVYSWDPAAPVASNLKMIDAAAFAKECDRIEATHGALTASLLAAAARDQDHIAHEFIYHVGQRKAAAIHYEERARLLVRCLVVSVADASGTNVRARIATSASADDGGEGPARYLSAQEVASRDDLADLHRVSLLRRMNLLRRELVAFDEFAAVVRAIERVLEKSA